MSNVLEQLLEAKSILGSHKNRRRLFLRFDSIFASAAIEADQVSEQIAALRSGLRRRCQFTRIRMTNWKAFESADLEFPETTAERPIVLIGGDNGNGKTSILDALIAGMYGVASYVDGGRGSAHGSEVVRRGEYKSFVERAFHKPAFDSGHRMASVAVELALPNGPMEIERRWYFNEDGQLFEEDEEVLIRLGVDRDILAVPQDEEPTSFYESVIASVVAPASMIPFFLFDGERVVELGRKDVRDQVRFGIESALGISSLKRLSSDLSDYIRDRSRDLVDEDLDSELRRDVSALEQRHAEVRGELEGLEKDISELKRRRDAIVHDMGALTNQTFRDRHQALEAKHVATQQLAALRSELAATASRLLPMVLVGRSLTKRAVTTLEKAARSRSQDAASSESSLESLLAALDEVEPELDAETSRTLKERVKAAWLISRGASESEGPRYPYLERCDIDRVVSALSLGARSARTQLSDLIEKARDLGRTIRENEDALHLEASVHSARENHSSELRDINRRLEELETAARGKAQRKWQIETDLEAKRSNLEHRLLQRRGSAAGLPVVDTATFVRAEILRAIERIVPEYYSALAEKVSSNYRKLAHKTVIQKIEISDSGTVNVYDSTGSDISQAEGSAGENQIFATALITAVAGLVGSQLPLVIDTPLGRLDTGHRERVLEFFKSSGSQVIILSQPEEVGGRYYEQIVNHVSAEYTLSYRANEGALGNTVLETGYFTRRAA